MKSLIERLEKASGPDRELDVEIAMAIDLPWNKAQRTGDGKSLVAPFFTSSLDAAMTLVPEGYDWSLFYDNGEAISGCMPASEDGCCFSDNHAPTPALALCIAALKAREAGK